MPVDWKEGWPAIQRVLGPYNQLKISAWHDMIPEVIADYQVWYLIFQTEDPSVVDRVASTSAAVIRRVEARSRLGAPQCLHAFRELEELALSESSDEMDFRNFPKLKRLLVSTNKARFENLDAAGIMELNVNECGLKDLSALASVPNLEVLSLDGTKLSSLAALSQMKKLRALYIEKGPLDSLAGIEDAPTLRSLLLATLSRLTSITPLKQAAQLEQLLLYGLRKVTDVDDVASMRALKRLSVEGMPIPKLELMARMRGLESLELKPKAALSSLDFLRELRKLRTFWLDGTVEAADVSVLLELPELRNLLYQERRHNHPSYSGIKEELARRHTTDIKRTGATWRDEWATSNSKRED